MSKPRLTLDLFATITEWERRSTGCYRAYFKEEDDDSLSFTDFDYAQHDLFAVHPKLPEVIALQCAYWESRGDQRIPGALVSETLSLWQRIAAADPFSDITYKEDSGLIVYVTKFHDVNVAANNPLAVELKINCLVTQKTTEGLPYAIVEGFWEGKQPCAWLESYFPGALERLETATALGLTAKEKTDYACMRPASLPAKHAVLPGDLTSTQP